MFAYFNLESAYWVFCMNDYSLASEGTSVIRWAVSTLYLFKREIQKGEANPPLFVHLVLSLWL